jgi:hypothetical protein
MKQRHETIIKIISLSLMILIAWSVSAVLVFAEDTSPVEGDMVPIIEETIPTDEETLLDERTSLIDEDTSLYRGDLLVGELIGRVSDLVDGLKKLTEIPETEELDVMENENTSELTETVIITGDSAESPVEQIIDFNDDGEDSFIGKMVGSISDLANGLKKLGITIINGVITAMKLVVNELVTGVLRIVVAKGQDNVIGSATFPVGAIEYRVKNSLIEENSRIFVSFTSDTGGKASGHGFTIRLSDIAVEPLDFDYWIVLVSEENSLDNDYDTALAKGWIYGAEEVELEFLSDTDDFKANDDLIFRFRFRKNNLTNSSLDDYANMKIVVAVLGMDGEEIDRITPYIQHLGNGEFLVDLGESSKHLKPGKHRLKILIEDNGRYFLTERSFTWGVLAINVNKSIYLPNERAYLQMAVLRDDGHTICDADLKLEILNPQRQLTVLTTGDGTIKYSGKCGPNNVTDVPDYFTHYQVDGPGIYFMRLTNLDTDYQITDYFGVRDSVPFDIERIGPTRIYPLASYNIRIKIKANQDFNGQIIERVPSEFIIINPQNIQIKEINDTKNLIWQMDLKAGEIYELKYTFDASDISPYLYLLGPLEIGNFQETRQWQIASDEPDTIYLHPTSDSVTEGGSGGTCPDGHYDCVNDQVANAGSGAPATADDANYVTTAFATPTYQQEMFGLDDNNIPNGNEIISIQVFTRAKRAAGNGKYKICYNDGTLTCSVADSICGNAWVLDSETWDFSGAPKDKTWLNSLIIGIQAGADADACMHSQIYVLVTHQALATNELDTMFLTF